MGRRSTNHLNHNKGWKDKRGGHLRIYWEVINSPAWKSLSSSGIKAYMALMEQKRATNNGDLSLPYSRAKHCGLTSEASLRRGLAELLAVGFIAITRQGGSTKRGQRLPNLYRFTEYECHDNPKKYIEAAPITDEWRKIKNKQMGEARIQKKLPPSMQRKRKGKSKDVMKSENREKTKLSLTTGGKTQENT